MADVIHDTRQEFWRPPTVRGIAGEEVAVAAAAVMPTMAQACRHCGTEFLLGARFCHACGRHRPQQDGTLPIKSSRALARDFVFTKLDWLQSAAVALSERIAVPSWLRYLHFHEIKRWIGLPTPSLISFMIGLGCVLGMLGISLFYRASNLAEFQAIQMWRIEWLLAAIASFVAGILLKRPPGE